MIRGRTLRPTRSFTPCSRGGSGAANTRRGPACLRKQNWRGNSAAGPTPRPGRYGHSSATGWPGGFSEEGTYRPDRMLIQASHDPPSRLRPQATSARRRLHLRPASVLAGRPGSSAGRRFRGRPLMHVMPRWGSAVRPTLTAHYGAPSWWLFRACVGTAPAYSAAAGNVCPLAGTDGDQGVVHAVSA